MTDVKAMVLVEPGKLAPTLIPACSITHGGWLAIEATGLSGAEVQAWHGDRADLVYPLIPGQQMVGRIAESVDQSIPYEIGTRVIIEPTIRCGKCHRCLAGVAGCHTRKLANEYGMIPSTEPPGLWGGLAERLYIDPDSTLHPLSDDIEAVVATFAHPLAAGYTWAVELPALQAGESILILGPGPRGLSALLAAQVAGAGWIGVAGLGNDSDRLTMARMLGAHLTVDVEAHDLASAVAGSLGSRPDVVLDVTSNDPEAIYNSLDMVRSGGRVVLASTKGNRPLQEFFSDVIIRKQLSVRGALGASSAGYRWACRQVETDPRIDDMVSHEFPLEESDRAIQAAAGLLGHDELISVAVTF